MLRCQHTRRGYSTVRCEQVLQIPDGRIGRQVSHVQFQDAWSPEVIAESIVATTLQLSGGRVTYAPLMMCR